MRTKDAIELLSVYEHQWLVILQGMRGKPVARLWPKVYTDLGLPLALPEELEVLRVEMRRTSRIAALAKEQLKSGSQIRRIRIEPVRALRHPPEERLFMDLLRTRSTRRVREICRRSKFWLNPGAAGGRPFVACLSKHADKLIRSKSDRRYPKSERPSSFEKRLTFLARALAGLTLGLSPRRAVNLLEELSRREKLSQK